MPERTSRPPNILVIMTDQQRRDSLGCYGNPVTATPNLDRLAGRGVRCERGYVANPICMPNRLSIFTGLHPRNHGLWTNGLILDERTTLPGVLAERGWQTASVGKVHFTPFGGDPDLGHRECAQRWRQIGDDFDWNGPYWGFQHCELALGHTQALAHYGRWFRQRGGTEEMLQRDEDGCRPIPPELHDSMWVAERCGEYLRQADRDRPFFLVASFPDPHHPMDPPREIADRYEPAEMPLPVGSPEDLATRPSHYRWQYEGRWGRWSGNEPDAEAKHPDGFDERATRRRIANTAAMVDLIDRGVGRILDTLDELGLTDDTLVVFTADHGELLGDHGLWAKGPFFYEGLVNVPMIFAGPGIASGATGRHLVSSLDVVPSLMAMAGEEIPFWCDGVDQSPMLARPDEAVRSSCLIEYRNGYGPKDVASVTRVTETTKYTRYQTGEEELTDLSADPTETLNRATERDCAEIVAGQRAALLDELLASGARGPEQVCHA